MFSPKKNMEEEREKWISLLNVMNSNKTFKAKGFGGGLLLPWSGYDVNRAARRIIINIFIIEWFCAFQNCFQDAKQIFFLQSLNVEHFLSKLNDKVKDAFHDWLEFFPSANFSL